MRTINKRQWRGSEADFYSAAQPPKNLARRKPYMQDDMGDIKARMTTRIQGGAEQIIYKQVRQEISNIETDMEDTVQMYGQRARARAGQMDNKTQEEGQELA